MRNAGVVMVGPGCAVCGDGLVQDASGNPYDGRVCSELGWCGCGGPEDIDQAMLAYLRTLTHPAGFSTDRSAIARAVTDDEPEDGSDGATLRLLLAYMADDLGWSEHGGSVYGAWLTDDGKQALDNLVAAA